MKEKHFLYMILVIMFLLMSVMTLLLLEGQIREKQRISVMEYEKLMFRFYQNYLMEDPLDILPSVMGFGMYNFYGESLYLNGSASGILEEQTIPPFFNKQDRTVVLVKDFLNPFIPSFKGRSHFEKVSTQSYQNALNESEEVKRSTIRFVYMKILDENLYRLFLMFRSLQVFFTIANTLIVYLIGRLYLRNMAYRKQIEEQERLVLLGAAARTLTHEVKNPSQQYPAAEFHYTAVRL